MKILHCIFALSCGGVETLLVSLANRQSATHEVEICTISPPTPDDIASRRLLPAVKLSHLDKQGFASGIYAMIRLARKIKAEKFDIVHVHGQLYYYILSVMSAPAETHFVYTVHNDAARENGRWDRLFTPLKRRWFRRGRLNAVSISKASERSFSSYYGSDVPSTLIPNGIEPVVIDPGNDALSQWRISKNTRIFINPGRLYVQKNQVELCKAFHELLSQPDAPDIQLLIAGPAEMPDILDKIRPYLSERILYIGARNNLPQMLASADAMIMPSLWEGMPMALLECLSAGCIPVCTLAGGMADIIAPPNGCGIAIASASAPDIAAAIKHLISLTPADIKKLQEQSRKAFAHYDISTCCNKYLSLYSRLSGAK